MILSRRSVVLAGLSLPFLSFLALSSPSSAEAVAAVDDAAVIGTLAAVLGGVAVSGLSSAALAPWRASLSSDLAAHFRDLVNSAVGLGKLAISSLTDVTVSLVNSFISWVSSLSAREVNIQVNGVPNSFSWTSLPSLSPVYDPSTVRDGLVTDAVRLALVSAGSSYGVDCTLQTYTLSSVSISLSGDSLASVPVVVFRQGSDGVIHLVPSPPSRIVLDSSRGQLVLDGVVPSSFSSLFDVAFSGNVPVWVLNNSAQLSAFAQDALRVQDNALVLLYSGDSAALDANTWLGGWTGSGGQVYAPAINPPASSSDVIGGDLSASDIDSAPSVGATLGHLVGHDLTLGLDGALTDAGTIELIPAADLGGAMTWNDVLNKTRTGVTDAPASSASADAGVTVGTASGVVSSTVGTATAELPNSGVSGGTSLSPTLVAPSVGLSFFPFNLPSNILRLMNSVASLAQTPDYTVRLVWPLPDPVVTNTDLSPFVDEIRPLTKLFSRVVAALGAVFLSARWVSGGRASSSGDDDNEGGD